MKKLINIFVILFISIILLGCSSTHKVTFDSNGGNYNETINVKEGENVQEPEIPFKEGYTFLGWYSDSSLNNPYDFSRSVTGVLNLYAKWGNIDPSSLFLNYYNETTSWSCVSLICSLSDFEDITQTPISGYDYSSKQITRSYIYNAQKNTYNLYIDIKDRSNRYNGDFWGIDTQIDITIDVDTGEISASTSGQYAYTSYGYISPFITDSVTLLGNLNSDIFNCSRESENLSLCTTTKIYIRLLRIEIIMILGNHDLMISDLYN